MRRTGALGHPALALSERLSLGKLAVLGGESRAANVISTVEEFMLKICRSSSEQCLLHHLFEPLRRLGGL
jgi:hypothetical protein